MFRGSLFISCLAFALLLFSGADRAFSAGYQPQQVSDSDGESRQVQRNIQRLPYAKPAYMVAYFEGGPHWEFSEIQAALLDALAGSDHKRLIRFPQKYHYSPGWNLSESEYAAIARSIMANPDIDMVVAMGSVASKALLTCNNGKKPVICLDVADPPLIGLVDPQTRAATAPNFIVDYVPDKWNKSIALLYTLLPFRKIGTMSSGTREGRTYSNSKELYEVGRERGFEIVVYEGLDPQATVESCKKGIEELIAQGIDALYVPAIQCFDPELGDPALLFDILHKNKVKTYAKDGRIPVAKGALIGISTLNYQYIGSFFSAALLQHVSPDAGGSEAILPFEPRIYLNNATARRLGITFPVALLINVDGIYDDSLPRIKDWPSVYSSE